MNFIIYQVSDSFGIILSFLMMIVMMALIYFLARSFFREQARLRNERALSIEGVLSKAEIHSIITSHISKAGKDGSFSLVHIDLDKFTEFINAFGQDEAEKILERLVKNIEIVLPKGVKLSRLQNDEFLVFLTMDYDRTEALELAGKIKHAITRPIRLYGDTEVNLTASIAIAFYPVHGETLKDLLNSLQIATYITKKNGGDAVRIYSDEMSDQGGEHVEYYYQIKHAIQHKEFTLYYHPIIDVQNNDLFGVEALIRWNHPDHGILSPYKFLPIMEQSGDIKWIGMWGLETIIKTFQELKQDFPKRDLVFTMNLSPKQLMYEDLVNDFQKLLKKYRMNAESIVLEIIEYAVFDKPDVMSRNLSALKKLGFQLAIDGFGLDYQTLSQVDNLEIDIIKLDNEFLKDQEAYMKSKFANLLIDFAERNKYKVICEAIENEEMLEAAKQYKIKYMQGYYYTKPVSAESLKGYIGTESWKHV